MVWPRGGEASRVLAKDETDKSGVRNQKCSGQQ